MEIKTKAPKVGKEATVDYPIAATVEENITNFGANIVNDVFTDALVVKIQAGVRRCLEGDQDPIAWAAAYKPGTKAPSIAKDPKAAAMSAISRMSDEEKKELIALLRKG